MTAMSVITRYIETYSAFLIALLHVIGATWINGFPESVEAVKKVSKAQNAGGQADKEDEGAEITLPCTKKCCFGSWNFKNHRGVSLALIIAYWPMLIGVGIFNFFILPRSFFIFWPLFQIYVVLALYFIYYWIAKY